MVKVIVIDKVGNVSTSSYKEHEDESGLYKVAGLKKPEGFKCSVVWNIPDENDEINEYQVYGKTSGKANRENKYDFPPPIDNVLFFDTCIVIKKRHNKLKSLHENEWEEIYEKLFGGFEDLGDEESEEEESDDGGDEPRTTTGYVLDDFIVEDYESEEDEGYDESLTDSNGEGLTDSNEDAEGLTDSIDSDEEIDDGDTTEAVERQYNTRSKRTVIPTVLQFCGDDGEDTVSDEELG